MQFGFISRQIVTGIIAPFFAFQPVIGHLQEPVNRYENNRQSYSNDADAETSESNQRRASAESSESEQTTSAQKPDSNNWNSNIYKRRNAQKKKPEKSKNAKQMKAKLGDSDDTNNHIRYNKKNRFSSQATKRMQNRSFDVSNKSGGISASFTIDKINALYDRGLDLKVALNYKSSQYRPIYLQNTASTGDDKVSAKPEWDLSLPAVYQTADEKHIGRYKERKIWKLRWQGSTYTFRPSHANREGKPQSTADYISKMYYKWDSTQFIYSHLTGNYKAHNDYGDTAGAKVRVTEGIDEKNSADTIKLKTAGGIKYVLEQKPFYEAYVVNSIVVPLKKPLDYNNHTIVKQKYEFTYRPNKSKPEDTTRKKDIRPINRTITVHSKGLGLTDYDEPILETKVAEIAVSYSFKEDDDDDDDDELPKINEVEIYTPDYSQNDKNIDNKTTFHYDNLSKKRAGCTSEDTHDDKDDDKCDDSITQYVHLLTKITGPKDRVTKYNYNNINWKTISQRWQDAEDDAAYCQKDIAYDEHDLPICDKLSRDGCCQDDQNSRHPLKCYNPHDYVASKDTDCDTDNPYDKYVTYYGPVLLDRITKPNGLAIEMDYKRLAVQGMACDLFNKLSMCAKKTGATDYATDYWNAFGAAAFPVSEVEYQNADGDTYKRVEYNFLSLGTLGPTWKDPKDDKQEPATFLHPTIASGFNPKQIYNSALRLPAFVHAAEYECEINPDHNNCKAWERSWHQCWGWPDGDDMYGGPDPDNEPYANTVEIGDIHDEPMSGGDYSGKRYGVPSVNHWLDPLFQTTTDRIYTAKNTNIGRYYNNEDHDDECTPDDYMPAHKRTNQLTDQRYGTKKIITYPQDNRTSVTTKYHYDATGRLVKKYTKKGTGAENTITVDYSVPLSDIGNTKKYYSYYKLPMDWNKPSQIHVNKRNISGDTTNYVIHKKYNTLGQIQAKYKTADGDLISGKFYQYTCDLETQKPFKTKLSAIHVKNRQSKGASFVKHYWKKCDDTNGCTYPNPLAYKHKFGILSDFTKDDLIDYADSCGDDLRSADLDGMDSFVTKIGGQKLDMLGNWFDWSKQYLTLGENAENNATNLSNQVKTTVKKMHTKFVDDELYQKTITKQGYESEDSPVCNSESDSSSDDSFRGDRCSGFVSMHKTMNRYGLVVSKTMQSGTRFGYAYDRFAHKAEKQIADKTIKKWKYSIEDNAYQIRVIDPVRNQVIKRDYNASNRLVTVEKKKSQGSYHTVKTYKWDGFRLQSVTRHKYAQEGTNRIGTVKQKPIYDTSGHRVGMYQEGKGLSHLQYSVVNDDHKVKINLSYRKTESGHYTIYKPITLTYYDKHTGLKSKKVSYSAKRFPFLFHLYNFALSDLFKSPTRLKSARDKYELVAIFAYLQGSKFQHGKPNEKVTYEYNEDGLLDKVIHSYPFLNVDESTTLRDYHYDEYGQLKYIANQHGNRHRLVKNLMGKTVQHKVCREKCYNSDNFYYVKDKVYNGLGQLVYNDVRSSAESPNDWSNEHTYNRYIYNDHSGLLSKLEKANGYNFTFKYGNENYPASITKVGFNDRNDDKISGTWKKIKYGKYNLKDTVKLFHTNAKKKNELKIKRHIERNDQKRPTKIKHHLKNIGKNNLDFSWTTQKFYNDLGQVYKTKNRIGDRAYTVSDRTYTNQGRIDGYKINPPGDDSRSIDLTMCHDQIGNLTCVRAKPGSSESFLRRQYQYGADLKLNKMVSFAFNEEVTLKLISEINRNKAGYVRQLTNKIYNLPSDHQSSESTIIGELHNKPVLSRTYRYTYNQNDYNGQAGHLTARQTMRGPNESFEYDTLGNITHYEQNGKRYNYDYKDSQPFTLNKIESAANTISLNTNERGRVTSLNNKTIHYTPSGKVKKIDIGEDANKKTISYVYGLNQKPIAKQMGDKLAVKIAGGWTQPFSTSQGKDKFYNHINWSLPHALGHIKTYKHNNEVAFYTSGTLKTMIGNNLIGGVRSSESPGHDRYYYYRYSAFGKQIGETPAGQAQASYQGFKNQATDPSTGWQYLGGNRLYDPAIGRFLQPDSQSPGKGGINPYRFAHNNPVMNADQTGHYIENITTHEQYEDWKHGKIQEKTQNMGTWKKVWKGLKHLPSSIKKSFQDPETAIITSVILLATIATGIAATALTVEEGALGATELATEDIAGFMGRRAFTSVARASARSAARSEGRLAARRAALFANQVGTNFMVGHLVRGGGSYGGKETRNNVIMSLVGAGLTTVTDVVKDLGYIESASKYMIDTVSTSTLFAIKSSTDKDWNWNASASSFFQDWLTNIINFGAATALGAAAGQVGSKMFKTRKGLSKLFRIAPKVESYVVPMTQGAWYGADMTIPKVQW